MNYIHITVIVLLIAAAGYDASCQPSGEPAVNWAEWNVSVAYITEINILGRSVSEDIYNLYSLNKNDGIAFSVVKPLSRFLTTVGIGMSDLRLEGECLPAKGPLGYWVWPEKYLTRIRTFNLIFRFHPFSEWTIHPYLEVKPGISGVKAKIDYPSHHHIEKVSKPLLKEFYTGIGGGITWEAAPMLSFDIGAEINRIPVSYLQALPSPGRGFGPLFEGEKITYGRLVVAVTSHSDISKLFRRKKNPYFNDKYDPHKYLPFFKKRK